MRVSVIILNYNGAHLLPPCIESLKQQDYPDMEIIVADNASTDKSIEVAKKYGVKILQMAKNMGFSYTNNATAKSASGELIFFVNNDMRFEPDCISELVKAIKSDETIFACDPMQYNWEGTQINHEATRISKSGLANWFPFISVEYIDRPQEIADIPWGCAGSLMVRKNMFLELDGFDETFFLDGEDLDLCTRAWMKQWRTVYVPGARLYHMVGGSFKKTPEWRLLSGEKNFVRFVLKVMSKKLIIVFLSAKLLQSIGWLFLGDSRRSKIILKAFVINILSLPEIMALRKEVLSGSKLNGEEVLKQFLH